MITGRYLTIGGVRAFVESAGQGPPVVCVHTAGQSGLQWRHVLAELPDQGYTVVVPDLPGHGRSMPVPTGPVRDIKAYSQWCLELFAELELERPYVLGCSIGGKISLDLAVHASERLRGVIACACDAHNKTLSVSGLVRSLEDSASPSRADRTYIGTIAAVGRDVEPQLADLIATLHRREDPIVTTCDLIAWTTHDLREALSNISCPTLVVAGEDDFWINAEDARGAASAIPEGRFELLPRIGHYPMEELPDFSARLGDWLRSLESADVREPAGP